MTNAVRIEPTRLPDQTMAQLRSSLPVLTFFAAQAMTIRLLPVNSSAPATTTRMRPRQKTRPPSRRFTPYGSAPPPVHTVVA